MKKIISVLCALVLLCSFSACGAKEAQLTQLGTSGLYISLPEGFAEAEDDLDEDQVAFYYKDENSIDFDVYQWAKEGIYTLETEAEYFAAEYGTTPEKVTVNGLTAMKYITLEEYDGYEYTVLNYMFDDGENIVELCFWTINTEEEIAVAESIVNTVTDKK